MQWEKDNPEEAAYWKEARRETMQVVEENIKKGKLDAQEEAYWAKVKRQLAVEEKSKKDMQ